MVELGEGDRVITIEGKHGTIQEIHRDGVIGGRPKIIVSLDGLEGCGDAVYWDEELRPE